MDLESVLHLFNLLARTGYCGVSKKILLATKTRAIASLRLSGSGGMLAFRVVFVKEIIPSSWPRNLSLDNSKSFRYKNTKPSNDRLQTTT